MTSTEKLDIQKVLSTYKKALLWGTVGLAEFYLLWSLMQFVIWDKPYLKLEKWVGLVLVLGVLVYLIAAVSKCPEEMEKIREFRERARSPEQIFMIIFFAWYILVCALRTGLDGKSYFRPNDNRLFYMAAAALLFFPLAEYVGRDKARRVIEVMLNSALIAYTPVCAWVLWKFHQGVLVEFPSGNAVTLYGKNALEIGLHRNTTASYSIILLGVCLYMLFTMRSMLKYLIYIPCLLIHLYVIILTNSRTSFVVLIAMFSLAIFMRGMKYVKVRNKALVVIAAVVVLAAGAVLFYYLRTGILSSNADVWKEKLQSKGAMRVRKFEGLNGRINIWKASLKLMVSSPDRFFLGVTPTVLPSALWDIGQFPVKQPHCHNLFLQVGCCFGVPMMIAYIWFVFSIVRRAYHVMVYTGDKLFKNSWAVSVIVFGILITEIMEVLTFANKFMSLPVFFMLSGWIIMMDKCIMQDNRVKIGKKVGK